MPQHLRRLTHALRVPGLNRPPQVTSPGSLVSRLHRIKQVLAAPEDEPLTMEHLWAGALAETCPSSSPNGSSEPETPRSKTLASSLAALNY